MCVEAGLFESKIRIRYACVHHGRFTKEMAVYNGDI
jgi:hypothetical protein